LILSIEKYLQKRPEEKVHLKKVYLQDVC